ncbi:META domain-containing protein [Marinilongibacter aquaticus]|uniref:META domain-containing protein n=1 Tax=Marinilongibacter aquaticus TaxID=2975157 RepID=UPI0021BDBBAB|nr:META domain-containing protein [Marinilongibacter aquaticus]UBM59535.1 META domain-containing protein [Marinilongibacter aquaticus]
MQKIRLPIRKTLVGLMMLSSMACSKNTAADKPNDLVGNWKVVHYLDGDSKITKTEKNTWPDINNGDITANFTATDTEGKGKISGVKVTNTYSGTYMLTENNKMSISPIISTEISEPDWTQLFQITEADTYTLEGNQLKIYLKQDSRVIVLEKIDS